jgi:hypothetical protein
MPEYRTEGKGKVAPMLKEARRREDVWESACIRVDGARFLYLGTSCR